jgi:hypothetical protein
MSSSLARCRLRIIRAMQPSAARGETADEVRNGQTYEPTDLYIVCEIDWWREPDGSVATEGGRARLLRDWTPRDEDLAATAFRYTVPR